LGQEAAARLCAAVDAADPSIQAKMIAYQHASLEPIVRASENMSTCDTNPAGSNFCKKGDLTTARKKSFLEKKGRRKKAATPAQPISTVLDSVQGRNFQPSDRFKQDQMLKSAMK
jgi:hypothetical protein